ncbi:MAG: HAD family phosphatase [Rikenellaceae bacterium]
MLSSIKNIIFDLGGVVIDLDRQRCVDSFTRIGFPEADKLVDCYHPADFFNKLERGQLSEDEVFDIIREKAQKEIHNEDIRKAYGDILIEIPLYKLRLIESLKNQGYKIYALSNINPIVISKVRDLFSIDGKKMEDYFDKLYLSYEVKSLKPDPEIFEILISDSGVKPEETLFIDDSEHNISAGQKFGLQVYLASAFEDYSHLFEK